jgi:hypothetical protein
MGMMPATTLADVRCVSRSLCRNTTMALRLSLLIR